MVAITPPGMAKTASLVREKTKKPEKTASTMSLPSLSGLDGTLGPKGLDSNRDAWANALSTMSGVYTPDPLTAVAKVAGMGLAGYGQSKAIKEKEAGSSAYRSKLADVLAGSPDNGALMGLMADPYADDNSNRMLMEIWQRNNPTQDEIQARQLRDLQMQNEQQQMEAAKIQQQQQQQTWQQQQDELARQNAIRGGKMDAVEGFMQQQQAQGGDLFTPEMQARLRAQGVEGVNPQDTRRYNAMQPYEQAGDYEKAFEQMNAQPAAKEGYTLGEGQVRFGPDNQPVAAGPSKDITPRTREYLDGDEKVYEELTPEGWREIGRGPASAGAAQTNITNDLRGETEFAKEAGKSQAGRFQKFVDEGDKASEMLGNIGALRDLGTQINTGKGAELMAAFGPWAQYAGISIDGLGEAQAYEAIVSRIAPSLRTPGVGSSSDFDARQFLLSLPQLGRTPEGNAIIQNTIEGIAQYKLAAAQIAQAALNRQITPEEADKQIRALGDPWSLWKAAQKDYAPKPAPGTDVNSLKKKYGLE